MLHARTRRAALGTLLAAALAACSGSAQPDAGDALAPTDTLGTDAPGTDAPGPDAAPTADAANGPDAAPTADAATDSGAPDSGGSPRNQLGINLGSPLDYDQTRMYVDIIKTSREPQDTGGRTRVAVDADGWPTVADFQVFLWAADQMQGTYALSFTGRATNVAAAYGPGRVMNLRYDMASNTSTATIVVDDPSNQNFAVNFTGTTRDAAHTQPGLTNIRLLRPSAPGSATPYAADAVFTTPIVTMAQHFQVLRFMDFTATNWNQQARWGDRTLPRFMSYQRLSDERSYGWQGRGGPWEDVVRFANTAHRDAWINVPVHADDDYVTRLAQLFAYGSDGVNPYTAPQASPVYPPLAADLRLYVEYSNETWNFGFSQTHDVDTLAMAEPATSPINYDGQTDSGKPHARYTAMRAAQISLIFRRIFGDAAMMTRVRPVLTSQSAWPGGPGGVDLMLRFVHAYMNNGEGTTAYVPNSHWVIPGTTTQVPPHPAGYYFYGGGGSGYYSPASFGSVAQVLTSGNMNPTAWTSPPDGTELDLHVPAVFGVRRVAYEGGPSFDAHGTDATTMQAVMSARPASPNMTDVFEALHDRWSSQGGDLLVYFSAATDAQWGFAAVSAAHPGGNIYDLASPKMAAVDELAARAPAALAYGTMIPGSTPGAAFETTQVGWEMANPTATGPKTLRGDNLWAAYLFRASSSAARRVRVTLSSATGMVLVYVDGNALPAQAAVNGPLTYDAGTLAPGLHGVIVRVLGGPATVEQVAVE